MDLAEFWRKRKIPEANIREMEEEKIDAEAVACMSDSELQAYLPHEGDRVSTRAYALNVEGATTRRPATRQRCEAMSPESRRVSTRAYPGPATPQRCEATLPETEPEEHFGEKGQPRSDSDDKKASLMKKLAEKMGLSKSSDVGSSTTRSTNKDTLLASIASKAKVKSLPKKKSTSKLPRFNAEKDDIKVDVGFSLYVTAEQRYKQVRINNGGGIRELRLKKPVSKQDIIDEAVFAFFPEGVGVHGLSEEFTFDLAGDVSGKQKFKDEEFADEFMGRLKMKKLRCYLLAQKNESESEGSETDERANIARKRYRPDTAPILASLDEEDICNTTSSLDDVTCIEDSTAPQNLMTIFPSTSTAADIDTEPGTTAQPLMVFNTLNNIPTDQSLAVHSPGDSTMGATNEVLFVHSVHSDAAGQQVLVVSNVDPKTDTKQTFVDSVLARTSSAQETSTIQKVIDVGDKTDSKQAPVDSVLARTSSAQETSTSQKVIDVGDKTDSKQAPVDSPPSDVGERFEIPAKFIQEELLVRAVNDPEITFGPGDGGNDLNNTQPILHEIQVHRGSVCADLIAFFSDSKNVDILMGATIFEIKMIKPNGQVEVAEDMGGVMRDALTEFYETFYLQYTAGNAVVVPVLRHDMREQEWRAVAAVIRMGYRQEQIFPRKMALPFVQQAMFGSPGDTLGPFLQYVPSIHRDTLKESLENGVSSVDEDELLEVLNRWKCKKIPKDETLKAILTNIGHKELVQKPLFVAECWHAVLQSIDLSPENLPQMYIKLKPTTRKVLKALVFPEQMEPDESSLSFFVLEFVEGLDADMRRLFLRSCTGSDLIVKDAIHVRFTTSVIRAPTSHTCGCVIEVPRSYAEEPYDT